MNESRNIALKVYVYGIFAFGFYVLVYILLRYREISIIGLLLFGLLAFAAENFSAVIPRAGSVSINTALYFSSLVIFGPATAILVALISFFNIREFVKRISYYKHVFNIGQYLLSIGTACILFEILYDRTATNFFNPANIGYVFLAAYVGFLINTVLTAGAIAINEDKNFLNIWVYNYAWLIPFIFFLAVMAIFIAFLYRLYGPLTIIFTSLPLIIAQYTYMLRVKERKALLNSIMQIVKIIEAKDPYTAGHSVRVAEYAGKIARKLRLNEYDVDMVTNLANLHDIGKVQIDLSVLNKPGKFDDSDWVEMKKHPEVGYEIVKEIIFLRKYAEAVLYHHERVDGTGYPRGVKGDKLPLFARILTVADAYDAMTSDRPYRKALTQKEAIRELKDCAGKSFDKKVSNAMIEIIKEESAAAC